MVPSPDTRDTSSTVVMSGSHGEAAVKDQGETGDDRVMADNPYLSGLSKKTRGLRKKLEKIRKTESLSAAGKVRRRWHSRHHTTL